MLNSLKIFVLVTVLATVGACTTHQSPRQNITGEKFLFVTDDESEVFRIVFDVMTAAKPDLPVYDLDGPIRGYGITWTVWLDRYDTFVRVYRAKGTNRAGSEKSGYYVEVSGGGTLILRGPALDKQIYEEINAAFEQKFLKELVLNLNRAEYLTQRDRWRLNDKPSLRDGGSLKLELNNNGLSKNKPPAERLKEIEELRSRGVISEEEYSKVRENVLKDL
jgi:hypothetical protein